MKQLINNDSVRNMLIEPPTVYPTPSQKVAQDLPRVQLPAKFKDYKSYLRVLADEGAVWRYGSHLPETVKERLDYELSVISDDDALYFIIIQDLVRAAHDRNLMVGPGRGSAPGSLICYCLGITMVDPIKHGLLFERFITSDRTKLPDIDIDAEVGALGELTEYLKETYGREHVANIITYCRDKDCPNKVVGYGVHACGIAMSRLHMSHYTPLTKVNGKVVTVYDGMTIEEAGPVKIDILESEILTLMHRLINIIREKRHVELNIDMLPLDDQNTLEAFTKGYGAALLCGGERLAEILAKLPSPTFDDLVAIHSLDRPGVIDSLPEYILRKRDPGKIAYPLQGMKEVLQGTYGLLIYQEQLRQLTKVIANFSRDETDDLCKAFRKKDSAMLLRLCDKFVNGGVSNGYPVGELEKVWCRWQKEAPSLFNKSHAVCHTMMAYQIMYLRVHFADEFRQIVDMYKRSSCETEYSYIDAIISIAK